MDHDPFDWPERLQPEQPEDGPYLEHYLLAAVVLGVLAIGALAWAGWLG